MQIRLAAALLIPLALVLGAGTAVRAQERPAAEANQAQDGPQWAGAPDEAVALARKSGKPVLVVTCWKDGVCHACDTWRSRVPVDKKVREHLADFELVEWKYDGLGGKVIAWTKKHGGESDDPNVQAFVLDAHGRVRSRAEDRSVFAPAAFGRWLEAEAKAFAKDNPPTRVPLTLADVSSEGEGTAKKPVFPSLDSARAAKRPVLVYVGRNPAPGEEADKAARVEIKAAHRFEKAALQAKAVAKSAKGWTTFRLDRGVASHRALAEALGVKKAPVVLLYAAGAEKPEVLDGRTSGASLAHRMDKLVE